MGQKQTNHRNATKSLDKTKLVIAVHVASDRMFSAAVDVTACES